MWTWSELTGLAIIPSRIVHLLQAATSRPMLPGMRRHDPAADGFLHRGQIIYAMMYGIVGGGSLIVWLDRAGNDTNGRTRHSDSQRAIVTTKPGNVILYGGERRTVERVEVWRTLENIHGLK